MNPDIQKNIVPFGTSLRAALERVNEGVGGVVLVVDEHGVLRGLLTDGDMRRLHLANVSLSESVDNHLNSSFTVGLDSNDRQQNLDLLSARVRHLPVVDAAGHPVDLISWAQFWKIGVSGPSLQGNEFKYVNDCLTSGWISSQGAYVTRFEKMLSEYVGGYGVATSSGTTALHLALLAHDIGPGDEVICPNLSFFSSASSILHAGAKPVFVDVDPASWNIDPALLHKALTARTRAVMPVHLYGLPCDMEPIIKFCTAHNLFIVEDCAESLGACYRGQPTGAIGDAGCFSFFANKVITTGEGGMIVFRDPDRARHARQLRDHGMDPERRYWHTEVGFNYRMTNLQAAIGVAQMEYIDTMLAHRRRIAERYRQNLSDVDGIVLPLEPDWANPVCWLYSILIDETQISLARDAIIAHLADAGIESRPLFYPLNTMPPLGHGSTHTYPVSSAISRQGISLPTSMAVTPADVDRVCHALNNILSAARTPSPRPLSQH